ncbi:hypothetical protein GCM10027269_73150 [Kribbella endophytica]
MYGQGSVMTGLTEDSDLDFILVWSADVPAAATLPVPSDLVRHGELGLEKARVDGYDVDLMHIPLRTFEGWMASLDRGDGWAGTAWPLPIYVAAGLATSELLLDPSGLGAEQRLRAQTPAPALVTKVRQQLEAATPAFVKELRRAAEGGHLWLHADLAVQLHKLIYTAWFLAEGNYPPFPKYLPQWYERFGMDPEIRRLEAAYWTTRDPAEATEALQLLAVAVLELPVS